MNWRELKNFINKKARENKLFLEEEVKVFDYGTGDQHNAGIAELLYEAKEGMDNGWVTYLAINEQEIENEAEAEETSID